MKILFNNRPAAIRSEGVYCKAGEYEHKWRKGWVVEQDGKVVHGNRSARGSSLLGSARYDWPMYRTRSELLAYLEEEAEHFGFSRNGGER